MKRVLSYWLPTEPQARRSALYAAAWVGLVLVATIWLLRETRGDWLYAAEKWAAKGRMPRIEWDSLAWVWKGVLVDAGLLALLFLTVRWWSSPMKPASITPPSDPTARPLPVRRWWAVLAGIGIGTVALWLRVPRLTLSLYNDEAHNFARLWGGAWDHRSGQPLLDVPRWGETLFLNNAGNNSQPFSLLARGCLDLTRAMGWSVPGEVTEWAVRLPSLVAGMLGLLVLCLLARRWFGFWGMVVVGLAVAVHPWHVRYSTEARGYGLMLLGISVMLLFADRAMASGRWRHWAGYAAGLWLCATAFLGSIYFLFTFSVGLFLYQSIRFRRRGDLTLVLRPLVASGIAVVVALPFLLPMLPQLAKVLETSASIRGVMDSVWWKDAAGYLIAGTRWVDADLENPMNQALARWVAHPFWLPALIAWCLVVGGGWVIMHRRGGLARLLLWSTLAAVLLSYFLMARKGNYLNHWYLLYLVPLVAFGMGGGWVCWSRRWPVLGLVLVGAALALPLKVAVVFRHLPRQQERISVELALGGIYPHGMDAKVPDRGLLLAAFWSTCNLYHPHVRAIMSLQDLDELIAVAKSERRDLYVCFSHRTAAVKDLPLVVARVEDANFFRKVGTYFGQGDAQYTTHLYQLRSDR